jgi:transposase
LEYILTNYDSLQRRKAYYIPLVASGTLSIRKCAKLLNLSAQSVFVLKHKYLARGDAAFVNGHRGLVYQKKKYSDELRSEIVRLYREHWDCAPFATFHEALKNYHGIVIPYHVVREVLYAAGIKPPRSWSTKEKLEHKPRDERAREGELVQMDASCHDWFMNGLYETIHGGIDDATHKITGLYMCLNECRLGYNEVLRQTWMRYGVPLSYYIDRHTSFVASKRKKNRTLEERLEYSKNESTHFVDLCSDLNIEVILALSAQGKGRIERLWQTLQGKLPYIFRYLHIDSIDAANEFLSSWVDSFNARFSVLARDSVKAWRPVPSWFDFDYRLSVKFSCRTDSMGFFTFHQCDFRLIAPLRAYKDFELCLSEDFGIRAFMGGKWYPVELVEGYLQDVRGDTMPIVEKDLIARYLKLDLRRWA